jgi:hypothetical protein
MIHSLFDAGDIRLMAIEIISVTNSNRLLGDHWSKRSHDDVKTLIFFLECAEGSISCCTGGGMDWSSGTESQSIVSGIKQINRRFGFSVAVWVCNEFFIGSVRFES